MSLRDPTARAQSENCAKYTRRIDERDEPPPHRADALLLLLHRLQQLELLLGAPRAPLQTGAGDAAIALSWWTREASGQLSSTVAPHWADVKRPRKPLATTVHLLPCLFTSFRSCASCSC